MHAIPMPCRPLAANDNRFWSPADELHQQEQRRLRYKRIVHEWTEKLRARLDQDVNALCNLLLEGGDDVLVAHSDPAHAVTQPSHLLAIREEPGDTEGAPAPPPLVEAAGAGVLVRSPTIGTDASRRPSGADDGLISWRTSALSGVPMYRSEYRSPSGAPSTPSVQVQNFETLPRWTNSEKTVQESDPSRMEHLVFEDEEPVLVKSYDGRTSVFQRCIAYPSSPKRLVWDFVGALLIMYDLFTILLQVFGPPETAFDMFMQWFSLTFWTLNMVASVFVGYVDNGVTIVIFRDIVWNYLKTWFAVDIFVVGLDWLFTIIHYASGGTSGSDGNFVKLLRILRLFRIVRLVRLLKLRSFANAVSDLVESEHLGIIVSIARMLITLLVINHIIACAWFSLGTSMNGTGWVDNEGFQYATWYHKYATSLHWAITQFTPASMSVQPHNFVERIFAVAIVVFALIVFAYILGSITGSLTQLRLLTENTSKQLWELRRHLKKNNVSPILSSRILRYVEHALDSNHQHATTKNVQLLPLLTEQLKSELETEICMPQLSVHPLFDHLSKVSRVTIHRTSNTAIEHKYFARADIAFITGEHPTHMYIVVSGSLVYNRIDSQGQERRELVDKGEDWMAEPVLWMKSWVHLGMLTALKECNLMLLNPTKFGNIVHLNPGAYNLVLTYVKNFMQWINSVSDDDLSDIWQGENVSSRHRKFMELKEHSLRGATGIGKLMQSWYVQSNTDISWVSERSGV
mmetsp:Transcript_113992/g.322417  ORF Transcript_113992/g.322417 Transcript_113992/m.322417 type:complete len:744 (-) Transcript_113992:127-2358(-)